MRKTILLAAVAVAMVGCSVAKKATVEAPLLSVQFETESDRDFRDALLALERVHFEYNSTVLTLDSRIALADASEKLSVYDVTVFVQGHADSRGDDEYNLALGEKRAYVVSNYMQRMGVKPSQLASVSFGEELPLSTGVTNESHAMNRRVDFRLMSGDVELIIEDGKLVALKRKSVMTTAQR